MGVQTATLEEHIMGADLDHPPFLKHDADLHLGWSRAGAR